MKKFFALLLTLAMVLSLAACGGSGDSGSGAAGGDAQQSGDTQQGGDTGSDTSGGDTGSGASDVRVAMITDYGDITDQSFNQTTYEASKAWSEANGVDFTYYKPAGDSTAERVAMVEKAADEGYTVIVMPGYAFADTIKDTADLYSEITFIALDVGEADLGDYQLPENVYCAVYQEELAGYMAGFAAVKLGYTHLGYLGGMAVPAVQRFGYGYIQGVDAAAGELGVDATIEYVYGNQFFGDPDITAYADNWYQNLGVEAIFACGGGICTSAGEAAAKVPGTKVIGVDVDQSFTLDAAYGEGVTLTSAMKGLGNTVQHMLDEVVAGNFSNYGGKIDTLGLVTGDDPAANYVQLPMDTTLWGEGFSQDDYKALVRDMFDGKVTVSSDITAMPSTSNIQVNDLGNIK